MILADNKNICEEIEIAILSEQELTDEQKKHIENCDECKALLSQVQTMKNNLGALSVPGLIDGQITEAVMQEVRKQKLSAPIPKFRLTHHLGTAAAIAIILVAALMIKNPSTDFSEESVVDNTAKTSGVTEAKDEESQNQHYIFASPEEMIEENAVDGLTEEEITETENGNAVTAGVKSTAKQTAGAGEAPADAQKDAPQDEGSRAKNSSENKQSEEAVEPEAAVRDVSNKQYSDSSNEQYVTEEAVEETAEEAVDWDNYGFGSYKTDESITEAVPSAVPEDVPEYTAKHEFPDDIPSVDVNDYKTPVTNTISEPQVSESEPEPESEIESVADSVEDEIEYDNSDEPFSEENTDADTEAEYNTDVTVPSYIDGVSYFEHSSSASSGGGNASYDKFSDDEIYFTEPSVDSTQSPENTGNIFSGIVFLDGEENFDYNIALANARLSELYGSEHVLTRESLAECGCTSNEELLVYLNNYSFSGNISAEQ